MWNKPEHYVPLSFLKKFNPFVGDEIIETGEIIYQVGIGTVTAFANGGLPTKREEEVYKYLTKNGPAKRKPVKNRYYQYSFKAIRKAIGIKTNAEVKEAITKLMNVSFYYNENKGMRQQQLIHGTMKHEDELMVIFCPATPLIYKLIKLNSVKTRP